MGWLEGEQPAYPEVAPKDTRDTLADPQGYLVQQAQDELALLGFSEARVLAGGLTVVTTLDRRAQAEAVRAVGEVMGKDAQEGVHRALVAVEPGTGRIRAEYAGADYVRRPFNSATQGIAQAGSSFKPYVLAAALEQQMSLKTKMNGRSPQTFGDYEVRNYGRGDGAQYGEIDLVEATAQSVNTVYVPLGQKAGLGKVAEVATRLGITADMSKERTLPSLSLGVTAVTPLDQAVAYATLAARGRHASAYLVEKVTDPSGRVVYEAKPEPEEALSQGVADDTTHALQQVVEVGTGKSARLPGRPAAGKTGTTTGNTAAWFVGYTPQLATAVALFSERQDVPLRDIAGVAEVTGGSLPARTWSRFMTAALEGQPVREFAPAVFGGIAPTPSPVPTPSASPSAAPSALPSPTAGPSAVPEPSPYVYTYEPPGSQPYEPPPDEPAAAPGEQPGYAEPSPENSPASSSTERKRSAAEPSPSPV